MSKTISKEEEPLLIQQCYLWRNLDNVPYQTEAMCLAAVRRDPSQLRHVERQTMAIKREAISCSGWVLRYVTGKRTAELRLLAVRQNGRMLAYIRKQTPEICLAAVQQCGAALQYVKQQTPEICMAAVRQSAWVLECVEKPTTELCLVALRAGAFGQPLLPARQALGDYASLFIHSMAAAENTRWRICAYGELESIVGPCVTKLATRTKTIRRLITQKEF